MNEINQKIDTIIKYLQSKSTSFAVSEINEISGLLNSMKVEEVKPEVTPKKTSTKEIK